MAEYVEARQAFVEKRLDPSLVDPEQPGYVFLDAQYIADAMMHAMDQPWGVSIGEVTVRATGGSLPAVTGPGLQRLPPAGGRSVQA